MMNRLAILCLGLSLSCASSTPKKKTTEAPEMPTPAWEGGDRVKQSAGPSSSRDDVPMAKLPFAQAKERADQYWLRADSLKTSSYAWEKAAEALALAAQATADDPTAAAPLLKGALAAWGKSDNAKTPVPSEGEPRRRELLRRDALQIAVLVQLAALTDPRSPDLARVAYNHGRLLHEYAHYPEAVVQFSLVVERFPASEEAQYAASLMLDSLNASGELDQLSKQVGIMLKNQTLIGSHPGLSETLLLVRHVAGMQEARGLVDSEKYRACEDAYMALFNRDNDMPSVKGDELLHNASVCFERSKQKKRTIRVLRNLVKFFPQSQFADGASERADALAAEP